MTLLHWVDFWHDWEHSARSLVSPDPLPKYPLVVLSHALPDIVTSLPFAAVVGAAVVGGGAVVVGGGAVVVGGGAVVTAAVVNGSHVPSLQRPLNPSFSQ